MKLCYIVIQEDRHYDTDASVYADRDEAIRTAATRIMPDVNRDRERRGKPAVGVDEIIEVGTDRRGEHSWGGVTDNMNEDGWCFNLCAYDDGPSVRVIEREFNA